MQFKYLKHDLYRYFYPNDEVSYLSLGRKIRLVLFTVEIWAICTYRFRRWVVYECRIPVLRGVLNFVGVFLQLWTEVTTGIWILPNADIGPGLFIGHFGDVVVGYCKLGKFCNISNGNSFGFAGRGDKRGIPEIGDFVYVGPGAKIIGKIKIGNHSAIGANAVVTKDIPENAVVAGVPAQIINFKSSVDFVEFNRTKSAELLSYDIIAEIVDC